MIDFIYQYNWIACSVGFSQFLKQISWHESDRQSLNYWRWLGHFNLLPVFPPLNWPIVCHRYLLIAMIMLINFKDLFLIFDGAIEQIWYINCDNFSWNHQKWIWYHSICDIKKIYFKVNRSCENTTNYIDDAMVNPVKSIIAPIWDPNVIVTSSLQYWCEE